jgi:Replication protein
MSDHQVEREDPRPVDTLAGETERGWDNEARLPERLARLAKAKERGLAMRDFILRCVVPKTAGTRRAQRELQHCGSYLVFRHYLESGRVRLHAFRSCRQHLICPFCAIRRGARMWQRYVERVDFVMSANASLRAYMVTLTVRDGEDLSERYDHLHRSVKRLHHRRHLEGDSEMHKVAGAVWSYEFKRGSGSGLWHPHVHAVYLAVEALDKTALAREWREVTGDSFVVDVHALYGERADAFSEVFKYAVKFANLPLEDSWRGYQVLKSRRLVASCGLLWGVNVSELVDEAIEFERYVELAFIFMRGVGYVRDRVVGAEVVALPGGDRSSRVVSACVGGSV